MQCRDAHFFLRLRRHANDELGADLNADLDRHLAGCAECALDFRSANSFDSAVATAMKSVAIPAGLRDKLLSQALAYRGTVVRRKVYQLAALAASLFLIVGVAYGVSSASRPKLDTDLMVLQADEQIQAPDKAIEDWLTAQHLPTELPLPFNTDLLTELAYKRIQGKDVPVIIFGGPPDRGFAKVYLFHKNGDFKLDPQTLRDAQASNTHAKVIDGHGKAAGIVYVIVFTGHDIQPFLRAHAAGLPG
jgi:hypothetical protein